MASVWGVGVNARPDGAVYYRTDSHTGQRVGVLPATCKRGLHSLHQVGYQAIEHSNGLRVSCRACRAEPHPDHAWWLTTTPPTPDRAELDDEPYRNVTPQFTAPPTKQPSHPSDR